MPLFYPDVGRHSTSGLVNNGLELHLMKQPRKAGEFGHDLHAVVTNPRFGNTRFNLGMELYMGSVGYHLQTIPEYVRYFDLQSMIVISKDNPFGLLKQAIIDRSFLFSEARTVNEIGEVGLTTFHHLPLQKVIADLDRFRDEISDFIPDLPTYTN